MFDVNKKFLCPFLPGEMLSCLPGDNLKKFILNYTHLIEWYFDYFHVPYIRHDKAPTSRWKAWAGLHFREPGGIQRTWS